MSYSLPVIVSNIPANLEVGLPSENYFTTGDIKELTAKLNSIMTSDVNSVEYDMTDYDWDVIAGQLQEVYKKL